MNPPDHPIRFRLQAVGCVLIAVPVALRALVATEPIPGWDLDPAIVPYVPTGLGPGTTGILSVVVMLGSALLMAGSRTGRGAMLGLLGLAACAGPLLHALVLHAGETEQVRTSLDWIAGFLAAGAIASSLRAGGRLHVLLGAFLISLAVPMAAKGVLQLTVEHSATMADYRLNSDRFLASRGWLPGSPQALQFERRLRQPAATGWFGLANVYGTFAGAAAVALCIAAWNAIRARAGQWVVASLLAGMVLSLWSVWASGSKGAWAASAFAGVVIVAVSMARRWRVVGWVGLSAVALPVLAVVARGIAGERVGELSLLFRWFYMRGTAGIVGETLPWGPGPTGFKEWYARLKPVIAPEDVLSPHSILFDYAGTLGLLSIPAIALVLVLAWRMVPRKPVEPTPAEQVLDRDQRKPWLAALALVYALTTAIAVQHEVALAGLEHALARIAGLAGGVAIALALFIRAEVARWAFAGAGLVVMAQSQIEMTPTQPASVGLALAMLGVAAACPAQWSAEAEEHAASPGGPRRLFPLAGGAVALVVAATLFAGPVRSLLVWQASLRGAAAIYADGGSAQIDRRQALIDLIGPNTPAPDQLAELIDLEVELAATSTALLAPAIERFPDDLRIYRALIDKALVRTRLPTPPASEATTEESRIQEAMIREDVARALELAGTATERLPDISGSWATLARVRVLAIDVGAAGVDSADVMEAIDRLLKLDPLNPEARARAASLAERFSLTEQARGHAARAIELSEARRLDPLTQLDERRLRQMRRLAGP